MKQNNYYEAFSQIDLSPAARERLLDIPGEAPKGTRSLRWGTLAAAAVLAVLMLSGVVYAAANWFQLRDGSQIEDPAQMENVEPSRPAPQNEIKLEDTGEGNYIGFTLNGWSMPDRWEGINNITLKGVTENRQPGSQASLNTEALGELYTQYFPISRDMEMLCVQVLDRDGLNYRTYFTRYETELVKEGTMNGMETVWLLIKGVVTESGVEDTYHLFCHSEALHCTLVVSSNRSFDRCEEALSHVTLVDSGVPIRREALTVGGLRLPEIPEGFEIDWEFTELLETSMPGWERKDPDADLSGVYGRLELVRPADGLGITIHAYDTYVDYDRVSGFTRNRAGTLNGHEVLWYDAGEGIELVYRYEDGTQAVLYADGSGPEVEALLEELATQIELVTMDLIQGGPLEFYGFAQG